MCTCQVWGRYRSGRMGSYPFQYLVAYAPAHVRSKHGQVAIISMVSRVGTHDDNRCRTMGCPLATCQIADLPASTSVVGIQMYEARARQHGCGYSTEDACMAHDATAVMLDAAGAPAIEG
jgi:hypothetical protein